MKAFVFSFIMLGMFNFAIISKNLEAESQEIAVENRNTNSLRKFSRNFSRISSCSPSSTIEGLIPMLHKIYTLIKREEDCSKLINDQRMQDLLGCTGLNLDKASQMAYHFDNYMAYYLDSYNGTCNATEDINTFLLASYSKVNPNLQSSMGRAIRAKRSRY